MRLDSRIVANHALNSTAGLLPDRMFGMDTDEVLSYSTQKMVWIRNRFVGSCYYTMIFCIVVWVVGLQILIKNDHFMKEDVTGFARLWFSHPTLNNCDPQNTECKADFLPKDQLVYCNEYAGEYSEAVRAHCKYMDRLQLIPGGVTDNKIFIPTAIEIITEDLVSDENHSPGQYFSGDYHPLPGTRCLQGNSLCEDRGGRKKQFFYVADIKNYVLRFTSSYERNDVRGNSLQHSAFVGVCDELFRKDNSTRRTWTERRNLLDKVHCQGHYRLQPLTCGKGVNCVEMRNFDFLEDTGLNTIGRSLKSATGGDPDDAYAKPVRMRDDAGAPAAAPRPSGGFLRGDALALLERVRRLRRSQRSAAHAAARAGLHVDTAAHVLRDVVEPVAATQFAAPDGLEPVRKNKLSQYSDNLGDVFTVGRLLQLAGADLDVDYNMDGWTTRQAGTSIQVDAVYNNLYPVLSTFGYKPVRYHYLVKELLLPYVSKTVLSAAQTPDFPNTRTYENRYGVLIHFKVSGQFGFFSPLYLILMLTAALALSASASTATDLFFLYVSDQRDNFYHLKYDVSPDFSDMWRCEKCGFFNLEHQTLCHGVPKYMCPKTTPKCGEPRHRTPSEASEASSNVDSTSGPSAAVATRSEVDQPSGLSGAAAPRSEVAEP